MTNSRVLLALDAGVRESGWAVFEDGATVTTGVIGVGTKRRTEAQARIAQLVESLDLLIERWSPGEVAHSLPSGIRWPVPALDLLSDKLVQWAMRHGLPVHAYTSQEVREAMTGHPNASGPTGLRGYGLSRSHRAREDHPRAGSISGWPLRPHPAGSSLNAEGH